MKKQKQIIILLKRSLFRKTVFTGRDFPLHSKLIFLIRCILKTFFQNHLKSQVYGLGSLRITGKVEPTIQGSSQM